MLKTTVKIDGMMCGMCEARVNEAISRAFPEAERVTSSHARGETEILSAEAPDAEKLRGVVEDTGYEFRSIVTEPA